MTATTATLPQFTDTMFRVEDLEPEVTFWTQSMQYEEVFREEQFAMLRDPATGQRLTLVRFTEVDAPYAMMAMKTDDIDAAIAVLEERGPVEVRHRGAGGDWALCCLRDTYPVMLWTENS